MTSSVNATNQGDENVDVKESDTVTTIQRIYRQNSEDLVLRDPTNRRSFINRSVYAKLHRASSAGTNRYSVDSLKGRFETLGRQNSQEQTSKNTKSEESKVKTPTEEANDKFTPESFGYPRTAKLLPPLIKPKPAILKRSPKDENSNVVNRRSVSSDGEETRSVLLQASASEESVDKIAKELNSFTMDGKPKEKKRSLKKMFLESWFGKDKKKKEEGRSKQKPSDNIVYTDNIRNESNFTRQSPARQTVPTKIDDPYGTVRPHVLKMQEYHERKIKELEQEYAQLHVNRFNSIVQSFNDDRTDNYVIMEKTKPTITDFISTPVNKYIDTSSSTSAESEKPNGVVARDTPPRAQETHQNITVVKPKAAIPINSERPLPNPFQDAPRTIERNLDKSENKDYPDKGTFTPKLEKPDFDSLEYVISQDNNRSGNSRPLSSSKPLSLESTKLKLPQNREIYEPQPRVKSPIPANRVSTDKIIATELLKNSTRSPTPPKRTVSKSPEDAVAAKPPMSPKSPKKPEKPEAHFDRIVTNAMVHAPQRSQTPQPYNHVLSNTRASTPVDLRMSVSMKMSPPKKEDVRKSVEEYYWKQLKKLKEEEDQKLYELQMNGYYEEQSRLRRSRSLSPSSHRGGKRSLSLPRDGRSSHYTQYAQQQAIPEDYALTETDGQNGRRFVYDTNFVRNNPERRSADSMQRPIFRRGSLTRQEIYESSPYNKRVSFSNTQSAQQVWPTRNGYTPTPPQRRIDRMDSDLDDEVFVQSPDQIYGNKYIVQKEPLYSNRVLEQFRAQQYDVPRQNQIYGQVPHQMGVRRLSMDSLSRQQDIYGTRSAQAVRRMSNVSQYDDYGRSNVPRYSINSQVPLQRNPVYSSRQSITDSNYGQKQVTMRNKYCDFNGQIHDAPQSGIVMGQLQTAPMVPPHQPNTFIRGSRLTASANDIGKRHADSRYVYDTNYNQRVENNYDNRPLPPIPRQTMRNTQISDTESGSDISEIQRIMRTKIKKKGFFGK